MWFIWPVYFNIILNTFINVAGTQHVLNENIVSLLVHIRGHIRQDMKYLQRF